jgi:glutathione S-transferase
MKSFLATISHCRVLTHYSSYVILAATSTFVLNLVHTQNTGMYRKPAGIDYPNAYATTQQCKEDPKAFAFNCAQRAHANYSENHATALVAMLLAGLQFPVTSAVLGFGWTLSRLAYMVGYSRSMPESKGRGRYKGSAFWFCQVGLIGLAGWVGGSMVLGN